MTSQTIAIAELPRERQAATSERIIVGFATLQMFVVIFLQKFALFATSFPLSLPMLVLCGGIGWMVLFGHLSIDPPRVATYLLFISACLVSYSFSGGSLPSVLQIVMLYAAMTVQASVSEPVYRKIFNRWVMLMILPAFIVIEQYAFQKITGLTDPLNLEAVVPSSLLLQGFNYAGHFPWNSPFIRPNGVFFLEPSFISTCTAAAAIIEITYFRRAWLAILMIVATFLTMGDTGTILLVVAAPFLLMRETPRVIITVVVTALLALIAAIALNVPLPLVSRANELETHSSSAGERLLMPAQRFGELVFDPTYIFLGNGAGKIAESAHKKPKSQKDLQAAYSKQNAVMNPWPIVKLLDEYGLLSVFAFAALFLTGVRGNFNLPLKVAMSVVYMFTGGYLLSPIMVELVVILCFMFVPLQEAPRAGYLFR